jgi:hypothetical protein
MFVIVFLFLHHSSVFNILIIIKTKKIMKKMEGIVFLQFFHLGLITHKLYKMDPIFSYDVSMNEYKLSMGKLMKMRG